MEFNQKILDLLLDMVNQQKETNLRLGHMDVRLEKLEKQMIKNNAAIGELRMSVMRLADENLRIDHIDRRLFAVENQLRPAG